MYKTKCIFFHFPVSLIKALLYLYDYLIYSVVLHVIVYKRRAEGQKSVPLWRPIRIDVKSMEFIYPDSEPALQKHWFVRPSGCVVLEQFDIDRTQGLLDLSASHSKWTLHWTYLIKSSTRCGTNWMLLLYQSIIIDTKIVFSTWLDRNCHRPQKF